MTHLLVLRVERSRKHNLAPTSLDDDLLIL